MKKIRIFLPFVIIFFSICGNQCFAQKVGSFEVKGNIKGYGNGQLIIQYSNPNEKVKPDTITVTDDHFIFNGSVEAPLLTFIKIMNNGKLNRDYYTVDFILENSKIDINAKVDDLKNYSISGSFNTVLLKNIVDKNKDFIQDFLKVEKAYKSAKDGSNDKEQLEKEMEKKKQAYLSYLLNYKGYFDNYAGTYSLWLFSQRRIPWQQLDTILPHFNNTVRNSPYFKYMQKIVDAAKRLQPGSMATDFLVKDLDGNAFSLKNFRGHYFLMTFSASWCVPCKLEYPFLRKAFEEYASKGLKMVVMNVDDSREKWAGEVKNDNFPFPILSDLNAFTGPFTKSYGVFSIPKVFLIDPEGKIVTGTIRQQGILDKLSEVYH